MAADVTFSLFTKPWKAESMDLHRLGEFVAKLGFQGVELPVRPGYQVLPENVIRDLPKAAKTLAEFNVRIESVAGPTDEATIAAWNMPFLARRTRTAREISSEAPLSSPVVKPRVANRKFGEVRAEIPGETKA